MKRAKKGNIKDHCVGLDPWHPVTGSVWNPQDSLYTNTTVGPQFTTSNVASKAVYYNAAQVLGTTSEGANG